MSSVLKLPSLDQRIPERSPCVQDESWLISLCSDDHDLIDLVRHLHNVHEVVTVGEFDAVGWSIVNTYPGEISPEKLHAFFQEIGRRREGESPLRPLNGATVIAFSRPVA